MEYPLLPLKSCCKIVLYFGYWCWKYLPEKTKHNGVRDENFRLIIIFNLLWKQSGPLPIVCTYRLKSYVWFYTWECSIIERNFFWKRKGSEYGCHVAFLICIFGIGTERTPLDVWKLSGNRVQVCVSSKIAPSALFSTCSSSLALGLLYISLTLAIIFRAKPWQIL